MRHKLFVIGVGPGDPGQLTQAAKSAIAGAVFAAAAKRHLSLAAGCKEVLEMKDFGETFTKIDTALNRGPAAVLVSGDTGIYSLLPLVVKRFPDDDIHVIPGISSVQSLCAAARTTWADAAFLSGHGRALSESALLDYADQNRKTVFFCGPQWNPVRVCRLLAGSGISSLRLTVGERLSYPDQKISTGTPAELADRQYDDLSLVLIENDAPWTKPAGRPRDEEFIRTAVPMTRETVRSAILDLLRLERDSVLWDLGAGTGSVSVAAALICDKGQVCAVEKNPEAVSLIGQNAAKFHRHNLRVLRGDNLEMLPSLPQPTHVFIGGSGPELPRLLKSVSALGGGIRIAVSAVSLKTWTAAAEILSGAEFTDFDAIQVSVSRAKKIGSTLIMAAQNSVTLFTAVTAAEKEGC
ncbi:MAG: precorrin-6y C5,15-methyltransferase (decarboxylating) subunit CbiE [Pyramidobacter sp.]